MSKPPKKKNTVPEEGLGIYSGIGLKFRNDNNGNGGMMLIWVMDVAKVNLSFFLPVACYNSQVLHICMTLFFTQHLSGA